MRYLWLAVGLLLALLPTAAGGEPWRVRYQPDLTLTHNGHPMLVAAIAAWAEATDGMVVNGGQVAQKDAEIVGQVDAEAEQRGVAWSLETWPMTPPCVITIRDEADMAAWVHEVGHCLGLPHFHGVDSVMNDASNGGRITEFDVQMLKALYVEKPYRVMVANIGYDEAGRHFWE